MRDLIKSIIRILVTIIGVDLLEAGRLLRTGLFRNDRLTARLI